MHRHRLLHAAVLATAVLTLVGATASQAQVADRPADPDQYTPLVAHALAQPHPVLGADGKVHLAYELLVANAMPVPTTVDRLEVLDPARGDRVLADLSGGSLEAVMHSVAGAQGRTIGAAQLYRIVLDIQLSPAATPRTVVHRLTVTLDPSIPVAHRFLAAKTALSTDRAVVVEPPLRGKRWVYVNGCCDVTGHRLAVQPINGGLFAAQRFAADIAQLDAAGRLFNGPHDEVTSYVGYGQPVVAASSGVVVAAVDGMPDQVPFAAVPPVTPAGIAGNHVVVGMGDGRFAFYAHLKPGSVRVAVGQRVRAGQQLAQLGNSGNSDLPHLHFHVMNSPSPLASDGLPYVLQSFDSRGSTPPLEEIDPTQPVPIGPQLRGHFERVIPMNRQVLDFR